MKCAYRNCKIEVEGRKFCCSNCRKMEATYKSRKKKLLNKYVESERLKVEAIKSLTGAIQK